MRKHVHPIFNNRTVPIFIILLAILVFIAIIVKPVITYTLL